METSFQLLSIRTNMAKRMVTLKFSLDLEEDTIPDNVYIMRAKPRAIVPCNVEVDGRTINLVFSKSWPEAGVEYSVALATDKIKSVTDETLQKVFPIINFEFETEVTSIVRINYPSNFSEVRSPFVVHWEEDSDHNDFSKSFYFELATENYFANLVAKGTIDKLIEDPDQKQELEEIKAKEETTTSNETSDGTSIADDSSSDSAQSSKKAETDKNSNDTNKDDTSSKDDNNTSDNYKSLYFKATLPDITKSGQYFLRIRPQSKKCYGEWSNTISVIVPEGKAEVPNPQPDGGNKRPGGTLDIVDYVAEEEKQKKADDQTKATPTTEVTTQSWVAINDDTPTSFEIAFRDAVNIDNAKVKVERRTI